MTFLRPLLAGVATILICGVLAAALVQLATPHPAPTPTPTSGTPTTDQGKETPR